MRRKMMNKILTVRKEPIVQRAIQFLGINIGGWEEFLLPTLTPHKVKGEQLFIDTLEGEQEVSKGEWLVEDVQGYVYKVYDDKFQEIYDFSDATVSNPYDKSVSIVRKDLGETYKACKFTGDLENCEFVKNHNFVISIEGNKAYTGADSYAEIGDILITDGKYKWSVKEDIFHQTYYVL
jgi:hypothetical protein